MPDSAVIVRMRQFKAGLLRQESAQMRQMANAWLGVERALDGNMAALAERMTGAARDGATITEGMLWQESRYRLLQSQLTDELGKYTRYADRTITEAQARMARLGIDHAARAIEAQGIRAGFARLPVEAVQNMVGLAGDGTPLRSLLTASWPDAAEGLTQALINGIALGHNPRKVARDMARGTTRSLDRMMKIARTEQLRVYRESSRQSYISSGVVSSYARLCAHDKRVCAACLMDEGHVFELDEEMPEHVQGRCTLVPYVKGVPNPQWKKGEEWFREQDAATQTSILGKGKYEAWQAGRFDLGELVTVKPNATWGDSLQVTPLRDLAGPRVVRQIMQAVAPIRPPTFTSGKEAAQWLVSEGHVKAADFGKLDNDAINAMVQSVADSSTRFGKFRGSLDFVGSAQASQSTLAQSLKGIFETDARTQGLVGDQVDRYVGIMTKKYKPLLSKIPDAHYAYYQEYKAPGGRVSELVVNEKWGKKSSVLTAQLEDAVSRGYHPQGVTTLKSVLDHETAHSLDSLYKISQDQRMTDLWIQVQRSPGGIADNLGMYATTDKQEFIAEAWAEYLNNPTPRPLARSVGDLMRGIIDDSN